MLLVPAALAIGAAVLLARALPDADGAGQLVLWWAAVLVGSTVVLALADRAARRLLPLAVLLELSLVFPDRAPSRLRAARTPSVRELEDRLAKLHGTGAGDEASQAAETLVTLVGILGLHDKRTRGHSERVRAFTDLLTEELGLPEEERRRARWAALVHDIGKLDVPGPVLNGSAGLDDAAWAQIRRHPEEGVRLAAGLLPWLGEWGRCVVEHHERYDGGGYPHGLAGEQISRAARIVSVCDSFEVMTSARSYNTVRTASAARRELIRCAGTQFDPEIVRVFVGISLGRLVWVLGPLTWLAQVPFVAAGDRAGQLAKTGAVVAVVGGMVAGGVVPGPSTAREPGRAPAVVAGAGPASGAVPGGAPVARGQLDGSAAGGPAAGGPAVDGLGQGGAAGPAGSGADGTGTTRTGPGGTGPSGTGSGGTGPSGTGPSGTGSGGTGSGAAPTSTATPTADPTADPTTAPTSGPTPDPTPGPTGGATSAPSPTDAPSPTGAPSPTDVPSPTTAPSPTAAPPATTAPSPTDAPSPTGAPSPTDAPSPSTAPSPSPSPTPAPMPVTREQTLYLSDSSLSPDAPTAAAPTAVALTPGGPAVAFDRTVDTATTVSGTASAVLHVRLVRDRGNGTRTGQVTGVLASCPDSGTCTTLGTGSGAVSQAASDTGYAEVPVDLGTVSGVVPTGGVLRLTVALDAQGNSDRGELGTGSASTPSRVVLTTTTTPTSSSGALPVAGVGLLTSAAASLARRRRDRRPPVGSHSHH